MFIFEGVLSFFFGAIVGSFLNVVILRMPKDESLGGRSHCMYCKHELGARDLIPIFSYIYLRARCRYCSKPISPRYFAVEVITGLLFTGAFLIYLPSSFADLFFFFRALFIIAAMVAIFVIDLENFLILDALLFPASIILIFFNLGADIVSASASRGSWLLQGVIAGLAISLFFYALYRGSKGKWMGFGDVKFGFLLGLATPGLLAIINVFLAYALGAVAGVFLIAIAHKKLATRVPFGTFLAVSSIITIGWGNEILRWYLHLIGMGS